MTTNALAFNARSRSTRIERFNSLMSSFSDSSFASSFSASSLYAERTGTPVRANAVNMGNRLEYLQHGLQTAMFFHKFLGLLFLCCLAHDVFENLLNIGLDVNDLQSGLSLQQVTEDQLVSVKR